MKRIAQIAELRSNDIFGDYIVKKKLRGTKILVNKEYGIVTFLKAKKTPISCIDLVCSNSYDEGIKTISAVANKLKNGKYYFYCSDGKVYNDSDIYVEGIPSTIILKEDQLVGDLIFVAKTDSSKRFVLEDEKQQAHGGRKSPGFVEFSNDLMQFLTNKRLTYYTAVNIDLDSECFYLKICAEITRNFLRTNDKKYNFDFPSHLQVNPEDKIKHISFIKDIGPIVANYQIFQSVTMMFLKNIFIKDEARENDDRDLTLENYDRYLKVSNFIINAINNPLAIEMPDYGTIKES